jgi:hypothetical protein
MSAASLTRLFAAEHGEKAREAVMGVESSQVALGFGVPGAATVELTDLSAVHRDGRWLWLAGDEMPRFERLTVASGDGSYGAHRSFPIGDFVDLPDGANEEVDAEG